MYHILTAEQSNPNLGTTGYTSSITFNNLAGFGDLRFFYEFCKPIRYRISIAGLQPVGAGITTTAIPTVFAFYPVNYVTGTSPTATVYSVSAISQLRGSVRA